MKFCLIGCGYIAKSNHGPAYVQYKRERTDFELAACCDVDLQRAQEMQKAFGFARVYTSHLDMLRQEKPDAVSVVVSVEHTAAVGLDVLRAGIPMIIEKPPGKTSAQTRALAEAAARHGVPNQVAFNRRFMPMLTAMRRMVLASVPPADVQALCYDLLRVNRLDEAFSTTAIHGIDAVRYLVGADYQTVRFTYQELPQYGRGVCNIFMDCEMSNGVRAMLRFCPVTGIAVERATLHARDHSFLAYTPVWGGSDAPGRLEHFHKDKLVETVPGEALCQAGSVFESNGFFAENKAFFDALYAGETPGPDIASAIDAMLVMECMDRREARFEAGRIV